MVCATYTIYFTYLFVSPGRIFAFTKLKKYNMFRMIHVIIDNHRPNLKRKYSEIYRRIMLQINAIYWRKPKLLSWPPNIYIYRLYINVKSIYLAF